MGRRGPRFFSGGGGGSSMPGCYKTKISVFFRSPEVGISVICVMI